MKETRAYHVISIGNIPTTTATRTSHPSCQITPGIRTGARASQIRRASPLQTLLTFHSRAEMSGHLLAHGVACPATTGVHPLRQLVRTSRPTSTAVPGQGLRRRGTEAARDDLSLRHHSSPIPVLGTPTPPSPTMSPSRSRSIMIPTTSLVPKLIWATAVTP